MWRLAGTRFTSGTPGPVGPQGPPGPGLSTIPLVNHEATPVVIGCPVYCDASGGYKRARANAAVTSQVIGLAADAPSTAAGNPGNVSINAGPLSATTAQWDAVTGDVGGLTAGALYWLSDITAGRLIKTNAPSAVGAFDVYIGEALTSTTLQLGIEQPLGPI